MVKPAVWRIHTVKCARNRVLFTGLPPVDGNELRIEMSMRSIFRFAAALGYMAGIFLLSSIPDDGTPETIGEKLLQWATPEFQNLLHIPLFGGLAATWYWALRPNLNSTRLTLATVFLITAAYSFLDEWHQLHVPGRYASLTDLALNMVGIVTVLSLAALKSGHQDANLQPAKKSPYRN